MSGERLGGVMCKVSKVGGWFLGRKEGWVGGKDGVVLNSHGRSGEGVRMMI